MDLTKLLLSRIPAEDRRKGTIVLAVWFAVTGLPVFFIPERVLSDWPAAAEFTSFVASYVPMIDKAAKFSRIPEVLRFYFACLWAAAPLAFVAGLAWTLPRVGRHPVPRLGFMGWVIVFAGAGLVTYVVTTDPPVGRGGYYRTLSSRSSLAFFGPLYVAVAVGCAAGIVTRTFGFLTGRLRQRDESQR